MVIDYSSLPVWFYFALLWTLVWKAVASWKAARKGHISWFVAFFVLNTFGLLPILYVLFLNKVRFYSINDLKKKTKKRVSVSSGARKSVPSKKGTAPSGVPSAEGKVPSSSGKKVSKKYVKTHKGVHSKKGTKVPSSSGKIPTLE
jgi:hypothetical protein